MTGQTILSVETQSTTSGKIRVGSTVAIPEDEILLVLPYLAWELRH